ncbi:MAG: AlkA N-terminal domain-containing protein [Anaeromyxobacter sp.]
MPWLDYRPPLDWDHLLGFLGARAIPGVERVEGGAYHRTVRLEGREGWLTATPDPARARVHLALAPALRDLARPLAARVRWLFGLDADPALIDAHLARDPRLRAAVAARPGLRVPGFFDGFEGAARAVLGQQVSVAAATTLAGRLVAAHGRPLAAPGPHPALTHVPPTAAEVAALPLEALRALGLPSARARTLQGLAQALASGAVALAPRAEPEAATTALLALDGVGPWTASYLAMRGLGHADAFPAGDLGVRKALGGLSPAQAEAAAERWRPWRAYAVMRLWAQLAAASAPRPQPVDAARGARLTPGSGAPARRSARASRPARGRRPPR